VSDHKKSVTAQLYYLSFKLYLKRCLSVKGILLDSEDNLLSGSNDTIVVSAELSGKEVRSLSEPALIPHLVAAKGS